MTVDADNFIFNFSMFCAESMTRCSTDAENEAGKIFETVNSLLKEVQYRSELSSQALDAIKEIHSYYQKNYSTNATYTSLPDLIVDLKIMATEDNSVSEFINPIISCLQFQDRLRQRLENMTKIIALWLEIRGSQLEIYYIDKNRLLEFGKNLLKNTTSVEEKDIIRKHILDLPDEEKVSGAVFF